jgi:methionine-rich copper-binding protein CopC
MRIQTGIISAAILALSPGAACAHAQLEHAEPRVGSHVAASPSQIRLWFSEGVEAHFSAIAIAAADGRPIVEGAAVADAKDREQLVLPLTRPLAAGAYHVRWHVVSVDSHKTQGDFIFTVDR